MDRIGARESSRELHWTELSYCVFTIHGWEVLFDFCSSSKLLFSRKKERQGDSSLCAAAIDPQSARKVFISIDLL